MKLEVTVTVKNGKGEGTTYQFTETAEAVKNAKTGKTSLAHFQPAGDNKVIMPFSKLYVNTAELKGK